MRGLLADVNADGHVRALLGVCRGPAWRVIWNGLGLQAFAFADLGMDRRTPDSDVWQLCQRERLVLVTGNRNGFGVDSLDATIRTLGTTASLPVVTVADMKRLLTERDYCERCAVRLLEFLMDSDRMLGSGRLYIP